MNMNWDAAFAACKSYDDTEVSAALQTAVDAAGGLDWVTPGMRVALKLNLVSAMKPEQAATVHPAVVCALVRMLTARGAHVILGDSPGGLYTSAHLQRVYDATGLRAAEALGAELNEDFSVCTVSYPEALQARSFTMTAYLQQADAIIDVCKLKTHGMMGNGPTQGSARPIGCLIAAQSAHKLDLAACGLIGLMPSEVPTLSAAIRRGLCPDSAEKLTIFGEPAAFAVPDYKTVPSQASVFFRSGGTGPLSRLADSVKIHMFTPRPKLRARDCVGCKKCANICPAKAITMRRGKPRIDRKACIHCFCCQEFCPKGAMLVGRTALAKLLEKG